MKISTCLHHLDLAMGVKGERRAVIEHRKFYSGYLKGMHHASKIRNELMQYTDYIPVKDTLLRYLDELKKTELSY
jgi:tRNA-dihydrouridine synthase B